MFLYTPTPYDQLSTLKPSEDVLLRVVALCPIAEYRVEANKSTILHGSATKNHVVWAVDEACALHKLHITKSECRPESRSPHVCSSHTMIATPDTQRSRPLKRMFYPETTWQCGNQSGSNKSGHKPEP
ncbi:hypothetical protein J6590_095718 [Homalodisca vitripennis]|nr:hypothetical protein J6590_095718 [Homalodisca vitripennis]